MLKLYIYNFRFDVELSKLEQSLHIPLSGDGFADNYGFDFEFSKLEQSLYIPQSGDGFADNFGFDVDGGEFRHEVLEAVGHDDVLDGAARPADAALQLRLAPPPPRLHHRRREQLLALQANPSQTTVGNVHQALLRGKRGKDLFKASVE